MLKIITLGALEAVCLEALSPSVCRCVLKQDHIAGIWPRTGLFPRSIDSQTFIVGWIKSLSPAETDL